MDNIPHSKSVYLFMDRQLPQVTSDTGAKNLLILHGLNHAHYKYCQKKVKDSLTHFLPHLPGIINMGPSDNDSSLRSLIEGQMPQSKPIEPLNSQQMDAFRLSANGAKLPEKLMEELNATARKVKKKKTDKRSKEGKSDKKKKERTKEDKEKRKERRKREKKEIQSQSGSNLNNQMA